MAKITKNTREPANTSGLDYLKFTHNWNGKLWTDTFTTIRIWQPEKYPVGKVFNAVMGKETYTSWGVVKIIAATSFLIADLDDYAAYLDTGYSAEETRKIIVSMYGKNNNMATLTMGRYLLKKQFN